MLFAGGRGCGRVHRESVQPLSRFVIFEPAIFETLIRGNEHETIVIFETLGLIALFLLLLSVSMRVISEPFNVIHGSLIAGHDLDHGQVSLVPHQFVVSREFWQLLGVSIRVGNFRAAL